MIKLNFKINKYYLAYLLLNRPDQSDNCFNAQLKQGIKSLKTQLWKKYKNNPHYYFIYPMSDKRFSWAIENTYLNNSPLSDKQIKNLQKDLQEIFQIIFYSSAFKTILKETIQYKDFIECQWNKKQNFILNYLEEIIGEKLPNISISVYIVHPNFKRGRVNSGKSIILGLQEDWPNSSLVYLTHELLHILFIYYKIPQDDLSHAIIELISDNELKTRLSQKGKRFKESGFNTGHPHLKKMRKNIYVSWQKYLKNPKHNLKQFIKSQNKKTSKL